MIDIEGPPGETIFRRMILWAVDSGPTSLQDKLNADLRHVQDLKDDRLLVLLGAMVVENAQDSVLSAIMPGFAALRDNRDITFSARTEILRALALIPKRLLANVDVIRQARNDFAHQLTVSVFEDLPRKRRDAMRHRLREFNPALGAGLSDSEVFMELVRFTVFALHAYERMVSGLSEYIRDPAFGKALDTFMRKDMP